MATANGSKAGVNVDAQIAVLGSQMDAVLAKLVNIEKTLKEAEETRSQFRVDYETRMVIVEQQAAQAHVRIQQHEAADLPKWAAVDTLKAEVKALAETVSELRHANRILVWFSGIVGSTSLVLAITTVWEKLMQ